MTNELDFVSFHNHSVFSQQDALIKVKDLVQSAKSLGHKSLAISEHGHLVSMPNFVKECEKEGINFRIACEFYFVWHEKIKDKASHHLLLIVKNEVGWRNMLKLQHLSNIPVDKGGGYYGRPRITEKMLEAHKEGIIVSSACISSPITSCFVKGNPMDAYIVAEYFRDTYPDFYMEMMPHGLKIQSEVNSKIWKLGQDLNIPVITTLDTHMKDMSYADAYCANGDNRRGRTKSWRDNPDNDCLRDPDFIYKHPQQIIDIYNTHGIGEEVVIETFKNTLMLDSLIDFKWENRYFKSPVFCENADKVLEKLISEKLIKKFGGRDNIPLKYKERARYEYDIISSMGFSNYFLILHDCITYCDSIGIVRGPGRGSVGSCFIAYILGVTKLDPVEYNLPMERFLNKDRKGTTPDADLDIMGSGREQLIDYLKKKWGETNVVQVANHSTVKVKAALKDAAKWLEIDFKDSNKITSVIPDKGFDDEGNAIPIDLEDALELPQVRAMKQKYPDVFDMAEKFEGAVRQYSVHAGAVCVLPEPAENIIPVMKKVGDTGADCLVSQWDKKQLESVNIHKLDFLGLSTLEVLNECEKMTGIKTDTISLDDEKTWNYIKKAENMLGIFQLMEPKTRKYIRDNKPGNLAQLSDINALIRPGTDYETYKKNRTAKNLEYKFDIPEVRDVLRQTYGAIVYQEDIMFLSSKLAGFSLGEGDLFRRALEKNDKEKIAKYKERFVENCKYKKEAEDIFNWIASNVSYSFNKSHSLLYSQIGYWCAYFKSNYPAEFLVANLKNPKSSNKLSEFEYIANFIAEAQEMGVRVELPKLNKAYASTTIDGTGTVVYGLENIKGIAGSSAKTLANIQATDFNDYVEQALANKIVVKGKYGSHERSTINKGHIKALCKIGFFGDPSEILKLYNEKFGEEEPTDISLEDAVNEAVNFEWFNTLAKKLASLPEKYQDTDKYLVVKVTEIKTGSKNGRNWQLIKGKSNMGEFASFFEGPRKGDVILVKYSKGRNDSVKVDDWRLLK